MLKISAVNVESYRCGVRPVFTILFNRYSNGRTFELSYTAGADSGFPGGDLPPALRPPFPFPLSGCPRHNPSERN